MEEDFDDQYDEDWYKEHGIDEDTIKEALCAVLIDKVEGEALTRVRAATRGKREYRRTQTCTSGSRGPQAWRSRSA